MYAVNAQTGALIWKVRPVDHYATIATATPRSTTEWFTNPLPRSEKHWVEIRSSSAALFTGASSPSTPLLARRCGQLSPSRKVPSPRARVRCELNNTVLREPASGPPPHSMTSLEFCTSPPETIIQTRRPTRVTPSSPWILRPESCSGQRSSPRTTPTTTPAPSPFPGTARRHTVATQTSGSRPSWSASVQESEP